MNMTIRTAQPADFDAVRAFYHALTDAMQDSPYDIGWEKDIYPAPDFLHDAIACGTLYVGESDGRVAAAMVLNHRCNDGYGAYQWPTAAAPDEVTVIHALGVHPDFSGRGYAKQLVRFAIDTARRTGQKALRLDVLRGNVPAERLYAGLGFRYLHTLPMYYPDTGWTDYELYEYAL